MRLQLIFIVMLSFISCIRNTETKNADLLQIKCENCKGDKDSEQLSRPEIGLQKSKRNSGL